MNTGAGRAQRSALEMDPHALKASAAGKAPIADADPVRSSHRLLKDALTAGGLAMALIAAILASGYFLHGDLPSFLAALRGDDVLVSVQKLSEQADGESRQLAFNVRVKNLTTRSFRVLGINDNCDCISVEGIPATVGAHESKEIVIKLRLSSGQSPTADITLITDDPQLNQVRVALL
jgi:hypothetical protein